MSDLPTGPATDPEEDGVESEKAKNFDEATRAVPRDLSEHAPQQSTFETPAPQRDVRHF